MPWSENSRWLLHSPGHTFCLYDCEREFVVFCPEDVQSSAQFKGLQEIKWNKIINTKQGTSSLSVYSGTACAWCLMPNTYIPNSSLCYCNNPQMTSYAGWPYEWEACKIDLTGKNMKKMKCGCGDTHAITSNHIHPLCNTSVACYYYEIKPHKNTSVQLFCKTQHCGQCKCFKNNLTKSKTTGSSSKQTNKKCSKCINRCEENRKEQVSKC